MIIDDDDDLVALPEVELDLSLFDDDQSPTEQQSHDTTKKTVHSREASPQLPSVDDVEYAGTKEQGNFEKEHVLRAFI